MLKHVGVKLFTIACFYLMCILLVNTDVDSTCYSGLLQCVQGSLRFLPRGIPADVLCNLADVLCNIADVLCNLFIQPLDMCQMISHRINHSSLSSTEERYTGSFRRKGKYFWR